MCAIFRFDEWPNLFLYIQLHAFDNYGTLEHPAYVMKEVHKR